MSTPTTTPNSREFASDGLLRRADRSSSPLKRAGRALAYDLDGASAATVKRDAIARVVMRLAVLALEIVAIAFVIAGGLGVIQQFGVAGSFGPSLWLPVLAIILVAGLGALFALALAAALMTMLRIGADVEAMKVTVDVLDRQLDRQQAQPRVDDSEGNGEAAAA